MSINVLLLGSGGREHALAWKLAQSPLLGKLFAAPGNPGIAEHAEIVTIDSADHRAAAEFCAEHEVELVVIGPEAPLVDGLADSLRGAGLAVFGPDRIAAQLEGSKGFTKDLCARHGIPTARYVRAADRPAAEAALDDFSAPFVVKADGLAAGKGVVICATRDEALAALGIMFDGGFGMAGAAVVIEEFLEGEEASFFALTDGTTILPFGSAQDHKRVGEGDTGPNTGGMGAYSPAPILTAELEARTMAEIVGPTVAAMAAEGTSYSGILYAGLMLAADGPKLIEYNVRFGDPECQVLMMRLQDDLLELMRAAALGRLADERPVRFSDETAIAVVMAAKGYPDAPDTGGKVAGIEGLSSDEVMVFQAGTGLAEGQLVARGGRVLNVAATGGSLAEARARAYAAVEQIDFPSGFWRGDIGWREIARLGGAADGA